MRFQKFDIPGLEPRPAWWQVRPSEIMDTCDRVRIGHKEIIAETPGGFPVLAIFYGDFSEPCPRVNWSAGLASGNVDTFGKRTGQRPTLMILAGIHGAEVESVAAMVNLITMLETGADLRGKSSPRLVELLETYRLIIVPCVNMDGRSISPDHLHRVDLDTFRRASQGVWKDGSPIGWLGSKQFFPLPLDLVEFPGGYPNGDGFNIMHDACPGHVRTAEARALLRLAERHAVDVILNCHSCECEPIMLSPSALGYPLYVERGCQVCEAVNQALYEAGLRSSKAPAARPRRGFNLNQLFAMASGALALTLECSVSGGLSFEQLMETNYVVLENMLEFGQTHNLCLRKELLEIG